MFYTFKARVIYECKFLNMNIEGIPKTKTHIIIKARDVYIIIISRTCHDICMHAYMIV